MFRPNKPDLKEAAFDRKPNEIFGAREWSVDFLSKIGYVDLAKPERMCRPEIVEIDDDKAKKAKAMRTLGHMADQYAKAAGELAELVGWDRVQEMVMDALKNEPDNKALKAMKQRSYLGVMDALSKPDNEALKALNVGIYSGKPGDALRRQADRLWVDRFDKRFCSPEKPDIVH